MRCIIAFILILSVLLIVAGCNRPEFGNTANTNPTDSEDHNGTTDMPVSGESTDVQIPMVSVSLPIVKESDLADDNTEISNYIYQNISMIHPEPEVADKIILDFLNRVDEISTDIESIRTAAKQNYTGSNWTPYLCQITYKPMRIDSGVLSLVGNYVSYSGTPHPESTVVSINYDMVSGDVTVLDDIITSDGTKTLIDEVTRSLNAQKSEMFLFDDFEDTVKSRFVNSLSHEYSWYFSETGLCFYFSAYEIAPYSSGVIVAEVPYEKLAGIMDNAYFPAEQATATGTLIADKFEENDLNSYDEFSEIIINENASKVLLHTDTAIYNVHIETGSWSVGGDTFTPEHTVFAAQALCNRDAIMVEANITKSLPDLRIRYQTNNKTVYQYLTCDEDNNIVLKAG